MTQVGESVAIGVVLDNEEKQTLYKCDWKNCKTTHVVKPAYPSDGTVDRNSSYADDWVGADLEPWKKYGSGKDSRATRKDYLAETPGAAYVSTAAAMTHPSYHTQKHHLVSVKLFKNVPDLAHNAKLVSYDVNHKNNGVCLPSYVIDIVRHDLQCHRGNHPNNLYYDNISPLLSELEAKSLKFCVADSEGEKTMQTTLVGALDRLSLRTEGQLRTWKWLLRSDAVAERARSHAEYAARQSVASGS